MTITTENGVRTINTGNRLLKIEVVGYAVLAALIIGLFCLLALVFSGKVALVVFASVLVLAAALIAVAAFIPFDYEKAALRQSESVISASDKALLKMALDENLTQQEVDRFMGGWDIEAAPIKTVMLVAYLMKTHPDIAFPPAVVPRLNGVLTFCRFQNLKRLAHFSKIGAAFNKAGIPFVILKGGAMKVYRPDFPRWMDDVDLLVREADFKQAVGKAMELGYGAPMITDHSIDLHLPDSSEGIVDIHRRLELFTSQESAYYENLFSRAARKLMFSVQGLLPSPEDMVFIALVNFYKNMIKHQSHESTLTTFFDISFLLSSHPGFDWDVVRSNARSTDTAYPVYFSALIIDSVIPGILPADLLTAGWMDKKERKRQTVDFLFQREIVSTAKDSFTSTKTGESLQKEWNVFVAVWVAFVSVLKGLFRILPVKTAILRYKSLHNRKKDQ